MSDLDRRISNLGKRLGTFVASTRLRITERGPLRVIRIREHIGGRFILRFAEAKKKKRDRVVRATEHLHKLKADRRFLEKIMHYLAKKYVNEPEAKVKDVQQRANDLYKKGGKQLVVDTLVDMYKESLVVGSPNFDAVLFDLVSQTGDEVVVSDAVTMRKEWVSATTGEPIS